jgi:hypothetical protein
VLGRVSPTWDTYLLYAEREPRQREMIAALDAQRVRWVLLTDVAVDGREELRFRNTHPLVWGHLVREFEAVPDVTLPRAHLFLRRRAPARHST